MLDLKTSLEHCTFCPRLCSHTCPVSLTSAREALTPQAKMSFYAARKLGEGSFAAAAAGSETALPQRPQPPNYLLKCGILADFLIFISPDSRIPATILPEAPLHPA